MRELNRQDLQWVLRRCPNVVLRLLKERTDKVFLGGGYVRAVVANEEVNDVDLFVPEKTEAREVAVWLLSKCPSAKLHETENAFTVHGGDLHLPVQIIHRWTYATMEALLGSFDFTVAMAGVWWGEHGWQSLCHDRFYEDLAARRLWYTAPVREEDAGGSLLRVLKFYQKGYRIPLDSMGAVVARLLWAVRPESLADAAKVITGLLREVDPNVDPSHLAHLPSDIGDFTDTPQTAGTEEFNAETIL